MSNLIEIKKFEVLAGSAIDKVAEEAIIIARDSHCYVEFKFNEILLKISPFDIVSDIVDDYYKGFNKK